MKITNQPFKIGDYIIFDKAALESSDDYDGDVAYGHIVDLPEEDGSDTPPMMERAYTVWPDEFDRLITVYESEIIE
jgi:hypothetical protein